MYIKPLFSILFDYLINPIFQFDEYVFDDHYILKHQYAIFPTEALQLSYSTKGEQSWGK
jgi:hypothetical protein